ncbi:MAG: RraA family protein, partial [Devosia sp.]
RGKVVAIDVPVECAGVLIHPGDILFGDADGVVVIPQAIEQQVVDAAWDKLKGENNTRDALAAGRGLAEVYAEFGVL